MRYVLVDLEGAVRGRYPTQAEARRALRRIEEAHPGMSSDLLVLAYEGRSVVGEMEGDEFLAAPEPWAGEWSVEVAEVSSETDEGAARTSGTKALALVG